MSENVTNDIILNYTDNQQVRIGELKGDYLEKARFQGEVPRYPLARPLEGVNILVALGAWILT